MGIKPPFTDLGATISFIIGEAQHKSTVKKASMPSSSSEENDQQQPACGWAARDSSGFLSPFKFFRRATGETDIKIKIIYCGICHSDLHFVRNEWGQSIYPMVPGHEIAGVVTEVGSKVIKFKIGDAAGIGCIVGACTACENCRQDLENYCPNAVPTFNSGTDSYGGFSDTFVVDERYAIHFPEPLRHRLDAAAPLMCGGITVYSPLKYFNLDKPGVKVGVAGLGGLGHLAVKFAKAFGAKVTVISSSPEKEKEAVEKFAADGFVVSSDGEKMAAAAGTMDAILDTVSAMHSLQPLLSLLKTNGKLILLGCPDKPLELPAFPLIAGRKMVAGSGIGGIRETQEMVNFAAEHNIVADVEVIPMDYVNTAMERLAKGDVRYRFVIDVANTLDTTQT